MLSFYGKLGFQFQRTQISKGTELHRALLNQIDFSICAVPNQGAAVVPVLQLGFRIAKLEETVAALKKIAGVSCILDPTNMPDGKKAVVIDPDGNSVELLEI
jgi:hypothetical protein